MIAPLPQTGPGGSSPQAHEVPAFQLFGWTEHVLPRASVYYSQRASQVVTDINLKNTKDLHSVLGHLQSASLSAHRYDSVLSPSGWELWLRDKGNGDPSGFVPLRIYVNHAEQVLTVDRPELPAQGLSEDDRTCRFSARRRQ